MAASSLQPPTTPTTLPPGGVGRSRGNVLNSTDPHTGTGEGSESSLTTGTGLLGAGTTSSTELDVEGGNADLLALSGNVLSGKHRSVRLW